MANFPFETLHLLIFTIPGFFVVWSFRKTAGSKGISDFEYLMFSVFWGVILLSFLSLTTSKETFTKSLINPYAASIVFSCMAMFAGSISGQFVRDRKIFPLLWSMIVKKIKEKVPSIRK